MLILGTFAELVSKRTIVISCSIFTLQQQLGTMPTSERTKNGRKIPKLFYSLFLDFLNFPQPVVPNLKATSPPADVRYKPSKHILSFPLSVHQFSEFTNSYESSQNHRGKEIPSICLTRLNLRLKLPLF